MHYVGLGYKVSISTTGYNLVQLKLSKDSHSIVQVLPWDHIEEGSETIADCLDFMYQKLNPSHGDA